MLIIPESPATAPWKIPITGLEKPRGGKQSLACIFEYIIRKVDRFKKLRGLLNLLLFSLKDEGVENTGKLGRTGVSSGV